jgi:hypothetical protein
MNQDTNRITVQGEREIISALRAYQRCLEGVTHDDLVNIRLLQHGDSPPKKDENGITLLMKVAALGLYDSIVFCLENGWEVDEQNPQGGTALFEVLYNIWFHQDNSMLRADRLDAWISIIELLINKYHADPLAKNKQQIAPRDIASVLVIHQSAPRIAKVKSVLNAYEIEVPATIQPPALRLNRYQPTQSNLKKSIHKEFWKRKRTD